MTASCVCVFGLPSDDPPLEGKEREKKREKRQPPPPPKEEKKRVGSVALREENERMERRRGERR